MMLLEEGRSLFSKQNLNRLVYIHLPRVPRHSSSCASSAIQLNKIQNGLEAPISASFIVLLSRRKTDVTILEAF
jgi:hypothetical protein